MNNHWKPIQIDSDGGTIGNLHWINSDTSTPPDWWCGEPFPNKFWGQVYFLSPRKLLQFYV